MDPEEEMIIRRDAEFQAQLEALSDGEMERLSGMLADEGGAPITPHKNADGSTSMRWFGYDVPMAAVVSVAVGLLMIAATMGRR